MRRVPTRPALLGLTLAWLLAGCEPEPMALAQVRSRGEIRVVTLNSPTTYYLGAHGAEGLEFELARNFAKQLGVSLVMYPVPNIRAMQKELKEGRADIAAAQLTADGTWNDVGQAANVYDRIPQLVVYVQGKPRPRGMLQIEAARLAVRANSPQERLLERIKRTVAPDMQWIATAPAMADPLEDLVTGQADYAIIDAREFSFARHLYPTVRVGFALPEERPVQWIVRRDAPDLYDAVNAFFRSLGRSGMLERLVRESSGDLRRFEYEESRKFREHLQARLRRFRPWFEEASAETGVDWRLLAAMGYQESKWNPQAQSPAGALGVMMLTSSTAEALGVTDRTDPRESILAGARYFVEVRDKIPARIPEPDRTWLAVAAYNVGFGHLEDARIITQMRGGNPDSWVEVRENLPLLARERWYTRVKRGYARGWEPVQYVDRVQRFLKLLEWQVSEGFAVETRVDHVPEPPPVEAVEAALPDAPAAAPAAAPTEPAAT